MSYNDIGETLGLGNAPKGNWPHLTEAQSRAQPIARLRPHSTLHAHVKAYILERLDMSEDAMNKFYGRWRAAEKRSQAYIDLVNWEQKLKEMNDEGKPPKAVNITIPYTFATISTVVTYLIHTFCGRKPIFQVSSYKKESVEAARLMELVLQYNADHTRLIRHLFQFLNDGALYGLGVLRTEWRRDFAPRTVWKTAERFGFGLEPQGQERYKVRENRLVFEGNEVASVDPFMFFPDPRVPMTEVNKRGEFVFWRSFEGKHKLKAEEIAGNISWVDAARPMSQGQLESGGHEISARSALSGGIAQPGAQAEIYGFKKSSYYQIDQGTIEIIPAELGLGESEAPEKWIFAILNKDQIVQAEPLELDHGMHPVAVIEPYTMGYGFGQPGLADYLGPLQDTMSWLVNSHMDNVKTVLNNMLVVDPSRVELQDLKEPGPGKIIRLKRTAYGQDARTALNQLSVDDVTNKHVDDFQLFMRMADSISSVTDNLRGLQDGGGRKTATEVRTTGEAAASRLAAMARLVSAQGVVDLTEQLSLNLQQNLSEEFFIHVVGEQGRATPLTVSPEQLVGDFYYPIHDGTLPLDRVALLDAWREIFVAVVQDPQLRQTFDITRIFEYIAELGGARNLDSFKLNVQPDNVVADQAQAGNLAPIPDPGAQMPGGLPT